jgi:hypothetical protein
MGQQGLMSRCHLHARSKRQEKTARGHTRQREEGNVVREVGWRFSIDDQGKDKSDLSNEKKLNREPNNVTSVKTTDQPKEGAVPLNSVNDADGGNQRRERDEKDKPANSNEPAEKENGNPVRTASGRNV